MLRKQCSGGMISNFGRKSGAVLGGSAISRCMSDPKERFPIPHSATHSIALNWSLCIMLRFMRWSRTLWRAPVPVVQFHIIWSPCWTLGEKKAPSVSLKLFFFNFLPPFTFIQSLALAQLHKFVRHRGYLATERTRCTISMQLGIREEIRIFFLFFWHDLFQNGIILHD